jgi:hypothetical protein
MMKTSIVTKAQANRESLTYQHIFDEGDWTHCPFCNEAPESASHTVLHVINETIPQNHLTSRTFTMWEVGPTNIKQNNLDIHLSLSHLFTALSHVSQWQSLFPNAISVYDLSRQVVVSQRKKFFLGTPQFSNFSQNYRSGEATNFFFHVALLQ